MNYNKETVHTISLSNDEYHDLLAILAYVSRQVSYSPEAPQHETITKSALSFWKALPHA
jgi:hypothetical protein